jgi:hypothetical protein
MNSNKFFLLSILVKKYWEFGIEKFECTIKIQESKGFDCFNYRLPNSKGYNRGYDNFNDGLRLAECECTNQ